MIEIKKNKKEIAFYLIFIIIFILLIFRCKYGFGDLDESFYLCIPYRLFQGDALFKDEWHLSLMSSIFQYPFVKIFFLFNNNTDGIILFFRYIFILFNAFFSIIVFRRLKMLNVYGAAICSISLLIYAPFHIMSLSYNSMGLIFFSTMCSYAITLETNKDKLIIGILYACSVLCCPYLAIIFIIVSICFIKKHNIINNLTYLFGIGIVMLVFFIFVFSKTKINDFITAIPLMLADVEHTSVSIFEKIIIYIKSVLFFNYYQLLYMLIYVFLIIALLFDNNKKKNRNIYLVVSLFLVLFAFFIIYQKMNYINIIMFPLSLIGPMCLLYENNQNVLIFNRMWMLGFIYTFCINLSSNQHFYAISGMSSICTFASILMLMNTIIICEKPLIRFLSMFVVIVFIIVEFTTRWNNIYWDNGIKYQNYLINYGPEKGLLVSKEKSDLYYSYIEDINSLNFDGNKVLFLTYDKQWLYLLNDGNYINCSYSSYLPRDINMLIKYYEFNPEKIPDNIYADYGGYNEDLGIVLAKKFGMFSIETQRKNSFYRR